MIKLIIFLTALFAGAIGFMWGAMLDGRYYDAELSGTIQDKQS